MNKIIEKIIDYAGLLIKPPLSEVGLMLQDEIKVWRHKRQLQLIEKVKKIHERRGVNPQQIPLKTFAAIIQNGSLEEDESLHTMWSVLLANESDSSYSSTHTNLFISILSASVGVVTNRPTLNYTNN